MLTELQLRLVVFQHSTILIPKEISLTHLKTVIHHRSEGPQESYRALAESSAHTTQRDFDAEISRTLQENLATFKISNHENRIMQLEHLLLNHGKFLEPPVSEKVAQPRTTEPAATTTTTTTMETVEGKSAEDVRGEVDEILRQREKDEQRKARRNLLKKEFEKKDQKIRELEAEIARLREEFSTRERNFVQNERLLLDREQKFRGEVRMIEEKILQMENSLEVRTAELQKSQQALEISKKEMQEKDRKLEENSQKIAELMINAEKLTAECRVAKLDAKTAHENAERMKRNFDETLERNKRYYEEMWEKIRRNFEEKEEKTRQELEQARKSVELLEVSAKLQAKEIHNQMEKKMKNLLEQISRYSFLSSLKKKKTEN
jgi:hypothetical protein